MADIASTEFSIVAAKTKDQLVSHVNMTIGNLMKERAELNASAPKNVIRLLNWQFGNCISHKGMLLQQIIIYREEWTTRRRRPARVIVRKRKK